MFSRRLLAPVFAALATALAVAPAAAQSFAGSNDGIMARWMPLDVALGTSAEGRRESETFSIRDNTYRVFVRDTGVTTARGPHDRVCVEWLQGKWSSVPRLAISTTSTGPDGRRPPSFDRTDEIVCDLLPPADAYRVWAPVSNRTRVTPVWDRWQAPEVFDSFEPMLDQDDADEAMRRNINRLIGAQNLDGVCVEISVIHAPFRSPDSILDWPMWFEAFEVISHRMRQTFGLKGRYLAPEDAGYVQPVRGIVGTYFAPWDRGGGPQRYPSIEALPPRAGYAHLHTLGFMTKEDIEIYMMERPLDSEQLPTVFAGDNCFGDPIVFYPGSSRGTVELYAFARISVVVPYWIEYPEADADARRHWQAHNDYVMRHELVHVYDYVALVNEAVFRARGQVDLLVSLRTNRPPGVRAIDHQAPYGLWSSYGFFAKDFFAPYVDDVRRGRLAAAGYFHNAIYGVDSDGRRTTELDIDMRTPAVRGYGDEAARRRAESAIIQKWVEPGGAAN